MPQLLVFGASGISGLGVIREALQYPSSTAFSRVIGLTNRPLKAEDALLPAKDLRLALHPGFDLKRSKEDVTRQLQQIPGISKTTHVVFLSYIHTSSHGSDAAKRELKRANVDILKTAIMSIESLAPSLEHVTIQTGGKAYGVEYLPNVPWNPPIKESALRVGEPYASNVFYYAQIDMVESLSKGKAWSWTDIRPDAVIGFVPNGNAMDLAGTIAIWLSMYRWVEGEGAEVVFPGNDIVWSSKHTDTSQEILGKSHVYAALSGAASGRAVNVGDGVISWKDGLWADICDWFGLKGVAPRQGVLTGEKWVMAQRDKWSKWEAQNGVKSGTVERAGFWFMSMILEMAAIDRQYDLSLGKDLGFPQRENTAAGYFAAFESLRQANLIA